MMTYDSEHTLTIHDLFVMSSAAQRYDATASLSKDGHALETSLSVKGCSEASGHSQGMTRHILLKNKDMLWQI